MEVKIGMEYLVNNLHVRQDVAKAISNLRQGDRGAYQRCLEELQDHTLPEKNAEIAMLCLEAKLKGENIIKI